jgi:sugar lactone lactonase YvrE
LSPADIEYILSLPEVLSARERIDALSNDGSIQFNITLTTSLRSVLLSRLNLNLENINEIPMRWIKGDTMPHIDKGKSDFNDTYLVYLNDSEGQFILEDTVFPIKKNTGFVFNEGLIHKTENTGTLPRLLLGPMNELAESVGYSGGIFYYSNKEDADMSNQELLLGISTSYVVGNRDTAFNRPRGIAIDASGIIYVADSSNYRIRKILPNGTVSTFAGSGIQGYQDGPAETAQFTGINDITLDISGNLYLGDTYRIRKILPNGTVSTLAGTETTGYQDGTGESASFSNNVANGIEVDANGNLYVVDKGNNRIRKILPNGTVSTIAGTGVQQYQDGPAETASFSNMDGMVLDNNGNLYVGDDHRIRKILPNGTVSTLAGTEFGHQDGPAGTAAFTNIQDLVIDSSSNLYVLEYNWVRKVTPDGTTSTIVGSGIDGYEDGPGEIAKFNEPDRLTMDVSGNMYIADTYNNRIRKVIPNGTVSTIAGSAVRGFFNTDTSLPTTHWKISSSSTGSSSQTAVWNNGQTLDSTGQSVLYNLYPMPSGAICFLEGTQVLCLVDYTQVYLPIEQLTNGVLVKTSCDGYKKIEIIAKEEMKNPGTDERIEHRLYKCSPSNYPELKNDLFITGCHSILVDTITDKEKEELTKQLGRIFVTDKKYRLTACADKRAEPWNSEGNYTIWHLVLEHENPVMNYGIYVNGGLLVESCSKHVLKNKSNMVIQ